MLFSGLSKGKNIFRFCDFYRHTFYFEGKVELRREFNSERPLGKQERKRLVRIYCNETPFVPSPIPKTLSSAHAQSLPGFLRTELRRRRVFTQSSLALIAVMGLDWTNFERGRAQSGTRNPNGQKASGYLRKFHKKITKTFSGKPKK